MLDVKNVSKAFGKVPVLQDINLSAARGQRIAFIGSNGAGKTTLIRCLLGEYNYQGSITIDGLDPRKDRQQVLSHIGFVPQIPPPLRLPVGQLYNYTAALCGVDAGRFRHIASDLGLDVAQILDKPFVKLSGGQKQKVLISIALGRDTDILILDEPAANLDPQARTAFFEMLSQRQDRALMIISSHRINEISSMVNRVVEMGQGKIVLDDFIADELQLNQKLLCSIRINRNETGFSDVMHAWGFSVNSSPLHYTGTIAGPDRLRFFETLSRYVGLVESINIDEAETDKQQGVS